MTTMTTTPVMLLQHQAELMAGMALSPGWSLEVDGNTEALFSARECERLAASAPTPYLAGFWFARSLAYREIQALTKRAKGCREGQNNQV